MYNLLMILLEPQYKHPESPNKGITGLQVLL